MKAFQTLVLFASTAAAGWVRLCSSDGNCFDMGSSPEQSDVGPVEGSPPFTLETHDFTASVLSLFDEDCGAWNGYLSTCDDCTSVTTDSEGPICGFYRR